VDLGGTDNRPPQLAHIFGDESRYKMARLVTITIRPATQGDSRAWLLLRHALWREASESEHRAEIESFFAGHAREPLAVLLAEDGAGGVVGLAELSIRPSAEGCTSDRVAYLEGWFVVPEARRRGVGRALVRAAEEWGRDQGCTEFASDTQPDNLVSAAAHRALGFIEVGSVRCFRKDLSVTTEITRRSLGASRQAARPTAAGETVVYERRTVSRSLLCAERERFPSPSRRALPTPIRPQRRGTSPSEGWLLF
jgi:aminoglycoside 6'-N-acetyltransferase I